MASGLECRCTRRHPDIVEGKLSNTRVELQEKRKRLANATSSTKNGNLGVLLLKFVSRMIIDSSDWLKASKLDR